MKGYIKTKTSVTLEDPSLKMNINPDTGANLIFNNVYLKIGNTVMTYTPQSTDKNGSSATFN